MLINIIVPCFNIEKYLSRCLESILVQSISDFEVIIVDDGSTDKSGDFIDLYTQIDSRIIVFHQRNKGQATARNIALDFAEGDYIAFVDGDDYIHPRMYEILGRNMVESDADLAICGSVESSDISFCFDSVFLSNQYQLYSGESFLKKCLNEADEGDKFKCWVLWDKLYKRECFEKIRLPNKTIAEDSTIVFKILYSAKTVVDCSDKLYLYYQNSESIIHTESFENFLNRILFWKEMFYYFYNISAYFSHYCLSTYLSRLIENYNFYMNNKEFSKADIFRKLFNKISIEEKLSMEKYAWAYKVFYPKRLKLFWMIKAVKNKLKG